MYVPIFVWIDCGLCLLTHFLEYIHAHEFVYHGRSTMIRPHSSDIDATQGEGGIGLFKRVKGRHYH